MADYFFRNSPFGCIYQNNFGRVCFFLYLKKIYKHSIMSMILENIINMEQFIE